MNVLKNHVSKITKSSVVHHHLLHVEQSCKRAQLVEEQL